MDIILIIGAFVAALLAVAGLFRPFLGLSVLLIIHFVQPGELIPALAPFRIELVYGLLLIVVLLWKASNSGRFSVFSDRIFLGALLLIGAGVLSVPFAVWQGGAAMTVIEIAKLTAFVLLIKLVVDSEARLRNLLWCMALVETWFAASSLYSYYHGQYYNLHYETGDLARAEGVNSIVGGPNELAGVLLAFLPLLIALLRSTRRVFPRVVLLVIGVVSLVAISLTGSRIALISLLAFAIYYAVRSRHKISVAIACLVLACSIWLSLPAPYKIRYLTLEDYASGGQLDASNELRLEVWRAGQYLFLRYPILGVGAGQFSNAYGEIYLAGRGGDWMNPHNLLIQVACELGIVGLIVFSYFLWQIAKGIRVALREKANPAVNLSYEVGAACSVMFVGIIILSAVSHTLYRPYWYLLAALVTANLGILSSRLKSLGPAAVTEPHHPYHRIAPAIDAHAGAAVFRHPQPALPLGRLQQEQNASPAYLLADDHAAHDRSATDLGPGTTFPAQYWSSGPNRQNGGDQ